VCVRVCVSADWNEEFNKENNTLNCNHQHVVCLYFFIHVLYVVLGFKKLDTTTAIWL